MITQACVDVAELLIPRVALSARIESDIESCSEEKVTAWWRQGVSQVKMRPLTSKYEKKKRAMHSCVPKNRSLESVRERYLFAKKEEMHSDLSMRNIEDFYVSPIFPCSKERYIFSVFPTMQAGEFWQECLLYTSPLLSSNLQKHSIATSGIECISGMKHLPDVFVWISFISRREESEVRHPWLGEHASFAYRIAMYTVR